MIKRFTLRRIFILMSAAGMVAANHNAMASAFALWEQDTASIGNYHAGVAATANDASTNWYNSAGITRIKNQQLVIGADPVLTDFRFKGTVANNQIRIPVGPQSLTAQGGTYNTVPFGHYVAPINDCISFGLSVDVPFGLKTEYDKDNFARYSATLTQLKVIDVSPSLAYAITDKLSIGVGPDFQRLTAELDEIVGAIAPFLDTSSRNSGSSTAWGYHAGALYQFTPRTRVGVSYHSQVVHHVHGSSRLTGPIAHGLQGGSQYSGGFRASATLPPTTSLGLFHSLNPCWDLLAHLSYTQWNVLTNLALQNVAGIDPIFRLPTNSLVVNIQEHYHNTWNVSLGANYHPNAKWILRTGIGYDESPAHNRFRNLQLPDSDRIAAAVGAMYQVAKTVAIDVGWTHVFAMNTRINNLTQPFGPELITTNGSVKSNADVYGFSVKWDIT